MRQQELGRELLPVFLKQVMISPNVKKTLILQQDNEAPQENTEKVTNLNTQQVPLNINTPNF